jgi:hypothetical protein
MASLTALTLSLLLGPWLIARLHEFQIGQHIREEGPKSHQKKAGTPTMGGVLIVVSILVPTLLWTDLRNRYMWLAVMSTLAYGAIGFTDDYLKIRHRRNLGLSGRNKMGLQIVVSLAIGSFLLYLMRHNLYSTKLTVPFVKSFAPDLIIDRLMPTPLFLFAFLPFLVFVTLVIVGSSNAVNLTDGLDGLAIGCTVIASAALTGLTYVVGHEKFSAYLDIQHRGSEPGFPLVQRPSRGSVHGRCRFPRTGRRDRNRRRNHQAGTAAGIYRWSIRHRSAVGDDPGTFLQAARQAGFPNVADTPSLRTGRLGGIESHHSILDCGVDLCIVQSFDPEIEVGRMKWC